MPQRAARTVLDGQKGLAGLLRENGQGQHVSAELRGGGANNPRQLRFNPDVSGAELFLIRRIKGIINGIAPEKTEAADNAKHKQQDGSDGDLFCCSFHHISPAFRTNSVS